MTVYLLPFEKMHGTGNDFVMLERRHLPNDIDESKLTKLLCDRHFGIGADGIILIDYSKTGETDFVWDYYNSDGSVAEMCGNGMRCFAKYVYEKGFTDKNNFSVLTKAGEVYPFLEEDGTVTVKMGSPVLPQKLIQEIHVNNENIKFTYIEIGNPHCVIFSDKDISNENFSILGPMIEKNLIFSRGVNVEFSRVLSKNEIKCRVWERGSGPTLSCGTGACAVLVAAHINNFTDLSANVHLPGGTLKISWDKESNLVFMNGTASCIYSGQFNLDPALVCSGSKNSK